MYAEKSTCLSIKSLVPLEFSLPQSYFFIFSHPPLLPGVTFYTITVYSYKSNLSSAFNKVNGNQWRGFNL